MLINIYGNTQVLHWGLRGALMCGCSSVSSGVNSLLCSCSRWFLMICCSVLSKFHPQPSFAQWSSGCPRIFKPLSMSSHYQILFVLYFKLLSNPCFLSSSATIVFQISLYLNWKTNKSLFFLKFLQPWFLTLETPSNHSKHRVLLCFHFTWTRQDSEKSYIPESRLSCCFDMAPYKTSGWPLHLLFSSPWGSTPQRGFVEKCCRIKVNKSPLKLS